jgi:PAS domain S-box-containing protein
MEGLVMKRIMLVDDEAIITMQLEKRLTTMGYEVVGVASSGEQSVQLARKLRPDLVLMDIVMPGDLDGIEAASQIRSELEIPIIFLTAFADEAYFERAKRAEPFGYLVKPFHEKEVSASIEIALHRGEIERRFRDNARLYRLIMESAFDPICLIDRKGGVLDVNPRAEVALGYRRTELYAQAFQDLLAEEERARFLRGIEEVHSEGRGMLRHLSLVSPRRKRMRFDLSMSAVSYAGDDALLLVLGETCSSRIHPFRNMPKGTGVRLEHVRLTRRGEEDARTTAGTGEEGEGARALPFAELRPSSQKPTPICTSCRKIKNEAGVWISLESFFSHRYGVDFSHGICSECAHALWPEMPPDMGTGKRSPQKGTVT